MSVEAQRRDPESLLSWMEHAIRRRKESPELGWGSVTLLETPHPAMLAHRCDWEDGTILAVHNLSEEPAGATLELGSEVIGAQDVLALRDEPVGAGGELDVKLNKPADAEAAFRESLKVQDRGVVHAALARLCQAKKDDACLRDELDKALATASGEELRELIDLADLLASVGRKKDAFALVKDVAAEEEQRSNRVLQLKAAQLAKELGDKEAVKSFCANANADGGTVKCP